MVLRHALTTTQPARLLDPSHSTFAPPLPGRSAAQEPSPAPRQGPAPRQIMVNLENPQTEISCLLLERCSAPVDASLRKAAQRSLWKPPKHESMRQIRGPTHCEQLCAAHHASWPPLTAQQPAVLSAQPQSAAGGNASVRPHTVLPTTALRRPAEGEVPMYRKPAGLLDSVRRTPAEEASVNLKAGAGEQALRSILQAQPSPWRTPCRS